MIKSISRLLRPSKRKYRCKKEPQGPKLLITYACISSLELSLAPELRKKHEGVAYLLGRTDGSHTIAVATYRPRAETSPGSFVVESSAMVAVVQAAARYSLQIVAQVHTHPGVAYHSAGDIEGARIRYPGYSSLVLPDYGSHLPSLDGAVAYMFSNTDKWTQLDSSDVIIIPGEFHG